MYKLSQIITHAREGDKVAAWSHYAQVELQHRQIATLLESTAEDERAIVKKTTEDKRRTLIPFVGVAKKLVDERRDAEAKLERLRLRIAEEHRVIVDNRHHIHTAMHAWLLEHDAEYAKSAEIERLCGHINEEIRPLASMLIDLLSRYGSTRNEIAVGYDGRTRTLSTVALAALDRLIHAYDLLMDAQRSFAGHIECLNELAAGGIFSDMRLYMFEQIVPPDCRRGMDYAALYANFEAGSDKVRAAIAQLLEYLGPIETTPTMMGNILFNYRDELWKQYLAELESGESVAEAPGDDRLSA